MTAKKEHARNKMLALSPASSIRRHSSKRRAVPWTFDLLRPSSASEPARLELRPLLTLLLMLIPRRHNSDSLDCSVLSGTGRGHQGYRRTLGFRRAPSARSASASPSASRLPPLVPPALSNLLDTVNPRAGSISLSGGPTFASARCGLALSR